MSYQEFKPSQFQQIPVVVKNILIINVVLFVVNYILHSTVDLDRYLDLWPIGGSYFKPHQFITYMFMHANIGHLFLNMLGVYMFGSILENIWGAKRFLNFYLLCGLGAAATQIAISFVTQQPSVLLGASGSLFGLLVAFAMMFPNTQLNLYFVLPVKAKYLVIGYAVYELYNGFFSHDNVAHFAHLGGLLAGIIILLIWKKNKTFFY